MRSSTAIKIEAGTDSAAPISARAKQRRPSRKLGRFALIPESVLLSREFMALSRMAVQVVLIAASRYRVNPSTGFSNNGAIPVSVDELVAKDIGCRSAVITAKKQAENAGLLVKTRNHGNGREALYALPWWPLGEKRDRNGAPEFSIEHASRAIEHASAGRPWAPK